MACGKLCLADLGAVRTAERSIARGLRATSRDASRRDPRRKWVLFGRTSGICASVAIVVLSFQIESLSLGRGGPPPWVFLDRVVVKGEMSRDVIPVTPADMQKAARKSARPSAIG
jgi:hypothetical protein